MKTECEDCKGVFRDRKAFDRHACTRTVTTESDELRSKIEQKRNREKIINERIASLQMRGSLHRRGIKLNINGDCNYCSRNNVMLWQYKSNSAKKLINVCLKCRENMLRQVPRKRKQNKNQNGNSVDALDRAQLGGGFETNRRKY